jgi:hypothetical protein
MVDDHVANLKKIRDRLRDDRRELAAKLAARIGKGDDPDEIEFTDLGEMQLSLEAIERAIEDEEKQGPGRAPRAAAD